MEVKGNFIVQGSYIDVHDNKVVNLSVDKAQVKVNGKEVKNVADDAAEDSKPTVRKCGRTIEWLFADDEHRKDEALTQQMVAAFVAKLKKEGLLSVALNSSRNNRVNQVFVEMYKEWRNQKLVPFQPNGKACIRFLQDDCKLLIEVGEKTYAEFIRKRIMED